MRSESAARRSLNNRGAHNTKARQALAASLLSEHRFGDALVIAQDLAIRDESNPAFRASVGEIQMELGQYDDARASFASVAGNTSDLSVAPRLARWAELQGHPDSAYRLMNQSLLAIVDRPEVPAEQKAWYWLRIGDLQLRRGRIDDAANEYQRGLAVHADDYRLLSAMAKLEGARHEWKRAIDYGERAVAVSFDPATLGVISDAYLALGDSAKADEYAHAMEIAVSKQETAYHREWSLFLLNHNRRVSEVLSKAQEELKTRQDIYGYDVTAWALHASGRDAEAREMMAHALSLGTQDAMLFYHAAVIDRALGMKDVASHELAHARTLNPYPRCRSGRMSELATFIQLGFRHIVDIGAMDHILFLLALAAIYRFRDWRSTLWVVTAFTVGHSITLALAVTGVLTISPSLVEFLIPLTIMITAIENIVVKDRGGAHLERPLSPGVRGRVRSGARRGVRELPQEPLRGPRRAAAVRLQRRDRDRPGGGADRGVHGALRRSIAASRGCDFPPQRPHRCGFACWRCHRSLRWSPRTGRSSGRRGSAVRRAACRALCARSAFRHACAATLLGAGAAARSAHPLHTTLVQLTYDARAHVLEGSIRVFAGDFAAAVAKRAGAKTPTMTA